MGPHRSWLISMRWHDLLFIHWPVAPGVLRPHIPAGLELDTYEGEAWIGVVPFGMRRVRPRFVPPIPWLSAFPELNVRTYVTAGGRGGVWFFSLDAANPLAVRGARWTFHLPYFDASMSLRKDGERVDYKCMRTHRGAPPAEFKARYRPTGPRAHAAPGSLDEFLTHRLCLYSVHKNGTIYRGDIAHPPWPLRPAEAEIDRNTMTEPLGVRLPDAKPLLHFAERLDVVAWRIRPID